MDIIIPTPLGFLRKLSQIRLIKCLAQFSEHLISDAYYYYSSEKGPGAIAPNFI